PWNDSSKNLVRDLAGAMQRFEPVVMQARGAPHPLGRAEPTLIYRGSRGRFAPGLAEQLPVLLRLLASRDEPIFHFFFAPNPRTSAVGRLAVGLKGRRSVHTVCSAPRRVEPRALFADRTVVLSAHSERRLLEAGVPAARLVRIPPAVPQLELPSAPARAALRASLGTAEGQPLFLYAGDLEVGGGAQRVVEATLPMGPDGPLVILACRKKTPAAGALEAALAARVEDAGQGARYHFVGERADILALIAAADALLLPSTDLYAKMDYPLVVLEALALGRPAVVAAGTPAAELVDTGGVLAVGEGEGALREQLEALAADAALRARLGAAGRAAA